MTGSPSEVLYKDSLETLQQELPRYKVLIIRGGHLSGKSTLLRQLGSSLHGKANSIVRLECNVPQDVNLVLVEILKLLGISLEGPTISLQRDQLIEQVVTTLNKNRTVLLIDNFDNIQDGDELFLFFLKHLTESKVVVSLEVIPAVDPIILMEALILRQRGFSLGETGVLLQQLNLSSSIADSLFEKTKGNPFFTKLVISKAITEEKEVSSILTSDLSFLQAQFSQKLLNSMSKIDFELLWKASYLQHDYLLRAEFLNKISATEMKSLHDIGFVQGNSPSIAVTEDIRARFPLGSFPDLSNELLAALRKRNSSEARLDLLENLIALEKTEEAAQVLNAGTQELVTRGDFYNFLRFSDVLVNQIGLQALLARAKLLFSKGIFQQVLEELISFSNNNPDQSTDPLLQIEISRFHRLVGNFDEAFRICNQISLQSQDGEAGMLLLMERSAILTHLSPREAISIAESALSQCLSRFADRSELIAECYMRLGLIYSKLQQPKESVEYQKEAVLFFRKAGNKYHEMRAKILMALDFYRTGEIEKSFSVLSEVEEEANRFSFDIILSDCLRIRVTHEINIGSPRKARELCLREISRNLIPEWNLFYARILVYASFRAFDYLGFLEACQRLLLDETLKKNQPAYLYFSKLQKLIQDFFDKKLNDSVLIFHWKESISLEITNRLYFVLTLFELNFRDFFPLNVEKFYLSKNDLESIHDLDIPIQYRFHLGAICLSKGEAAKAEEHLVISLENSKKVGFHYWNARALIYLSILDIAKNDIGHAESRLNRVSELISEFEPMKEMDLRFVLEAFCALKKENVEVALKSFGKLPVDSPFQYFSSAIAEKVTGMRAVPFPPLTPAEKKFFDQILIYVGYKTKTRLRVISHLGIKNYEESNLPTINDRDFDLVFDELNNETKAKGKTIDLTDKAVLSSLLKFLLVERNQSFSKEELVSRVWQERYNPLAHDSRVYTSIKRIREILKKAIRVDPIRTNGGRYSIDQSIRFAIIRSLTAHSDLNDRQEWILKYASNNGSVNRIAVEKILKVSPTLCKSDLKNLVDRGYLLSEGKGKNTRYILK